MSITLVSKRLKRHSRLRIQLQSKPMVESWPHFGSKLQGLHDGNKKSSMLAWIMRFIGEQNERHSRNVALIILFKTLKCVSFASKLSKMAPESANSQERDSPPGENRHPSSTRYPDGSVLSCHVTGSVE